MTRSVFTSVTQVYINLAIAAQIFIVAFPATIDARIPIVTSACSQQHFLETIGDFVLELLQVIHLYELFDVLPCLKNPHTFMKVLFALRSNETLRSLIVKGIKHGNSFVLHPKAKGKAPGDGFEMLIGALAYYRHDWQAIKVWHRRTFTPLILAAVWGLDKRSNM
ncbi:hypothetical protein C8J56DRAFT_1065637 [Mycena floridula]|nr:hypothetical protein C8J56DRAFT_1065637 [Mycena floridula]